MPPMSWCRPGITQGPSGPTSPCATASSASSATAGLRRRRRSTPASALRTTSHTWRKSSASAPYCWATWYPVGPIRPSSRRTSTGPRWAATGKPPRRCPGRCPGPIRTRPRRSPRWPRWAWWPSTGASTTLRPRGCRRRPTRPRTTGWPGRASCSTRERLLPRRA